jgi:hypothetical protein
MSMNCRYSSMYTFIYACMLHKNRNSYPMTGATYIHTHHSAFIHSYTHTQVDGMSPGDKGGLQATLKLSKQSKVNYQNNQIHTYIHTCMYGVYERKIHVCLRAYMYAYLCVCIFWPGYPSAVYVCIHVCMYVDIYIYIYIYILLYACIYLYIYIYTYIYIYIYTHTHTHTYIYIYIYIYADIHTYEQIPIVCICNDDSSKKIRTFAQHCFRIRFYKPKAYVYVYVCMYMYICMYMFLRMRVCVLYVYICMSVCM